MKCSMLYNSKTAFMLFMILLFELGDSCPTSCVCKWKNGKQTVECINKGLLIIPEGMDSGTQVLEFCGNNLQTLHREKFLKMDLINLQRIYLCRCRITSIDDRTFKGLTNLVELDLSGNLLEAVPSETFLDCPSLMRLTLDSNPIKTLRRSAFNHLSFLNTLELSHCEISKLDEGAFQGLYRLEWLHLNGNRLTNLEGSRYLPESLKGIQLQENPWECDCHILELHAWLRTLSIAHSVEPVCSGPYRLQGRTIKSVPLGELACLPDVSPTTFYLEIGEGKNVSLLCQVHAVPEAQISWRFQGQLLQNDSMIAPGVHLLYYIEEGTVEKRSELFIYNTNTDDNGTFICNAENPAGVTQANFTIKVVVKHDPPTDSNELPLEIIVTVMTAAAISVILLILVIILYLIKCHRNSRLKKKRNNSKVALSHSTKDNLLQDSVEEFTDNLKESSSIKLVNHEEETMLYSAHPNEELLKAMSSITTANQVASPTSLRRYQLEQNPDLINGTESVEREIECEGHQLKENIQTYPTPLKKRLSNNTLPRNFQQSMVDFKGNDCDLYMLTPDVHLNPVGLLNPGDGSRQQFNGNCYRTLPYNRANKRQTAANPITRYSQEAEFLTRTSQPASYEHFTNNVRYTVDGYPVRTTEPTPYPVFVPSPANSYKSDSAVTSTISEPCCSAKVQWPQCVPANLKVKTGDNVIIKKCVGAQTQTESDISCSSSSGSSSSSINKPINKPVNKSVNNLVKIQETLNESPDEGYEGESVDN